MIAQTRATSRSPGPPAMYALIFAILWTVVSTALILGTLSELADWERALAILVPVFGLFAIRASWLALRRRRSLRVEQEGGLSVYVWIEMDGTERRSTRDPRDDWDGDGDGDGDGGD
ncbi:hypothetical protein [Roseicyclus persicicus]|uniref:Uncharacterized protein n=1 Tax=Roseicyclus persicicus TaxID=2650661 RepID=A0A7X6GYJ6_9RHOB|nr:hypothetical protein [Roseibacterium persicicum]NKX44777.1 hypothetical protein [Roseibacterium persicicum]